MGFSIFVRSIVALLAIVSVSQAQEVGVTSCVVGNAGTLTYTAGGTAQTVTVTLDLEETSSTAAGSVTAISFYFTNSAAFQDAQTIKSSPVVHTLSSPQSVTSGGVATITDAEIENVSIDVENCQDYSHACIVITATGDTDATNDFSCLTLGATGTDAGTEKCPDIVASAFSISSPSTITYDTTDDTDIAFGISAAATDGDGTVTGVKLYFTDSDDYDTAGTTSVAFDAGNVASTNVANGNTDPIAGATASLRLDAANCDDYTHLCAVLQISSTDTITTNNDVCIEFGTETAEAGSKNCTAGDTSTKTSTVQETTPGDSATSVSSFSILFILFFAIAAKFAM